jgi:tRNA uridine 5-carboxymethylaminomethyl modification enzyme
VELWPVLEADFKYEGHINRQQQEINRFKKQETAIIPDDMDYEALTGLKAEARHRFGTIRPRTLGQAARISGITPADVNLLMISLERRRKAKKLEA